MAFVVPRATAELLQAGPFISSLDGVTVLTGLTIPPALRLLSANGTPFVATTDTSTAVHMNDGYYSFLLTPADLIALGTVRLALNVPGALPTWLDLVTVAPSTYNTLGGVQSAPIVLQGAPVTLTMGPFVASLDGVTLMNSLNIAPGQVRLSSNDGPFAPTSGVANAVPLGEGHYAVMLTATDVATLGSLRVSIELSSALPVWLDVAVVNATTYNFYFQGTPPVVVVPPIPPGPTPPPPPAGPGGMPYSLQRLLVETIWQEAYTGQDSYGKPMYAAAVARRARLEYEFTTVARAGGAERVSTTKLFLNGDAPVSVRDKIVLSDGSSPAIQDVRSPRQPFDPARIHHYEVIL